MTSQDPDKAYVRRTSGGFQVQKEHNSLTLTLLRLAPKPLRPYGIPRFDLTKGDANRGLCFKSFDIVVNQARDV